ncbi:MAG TPA: Asp-tRNA(Asn)/Glu-tRNA(Gln) amidotransferase subunit GatC [Candidatus Binatia bacterium]
MKITREEVQRVALLARLQLSPDEENRLTEQLDKILQYMEKLDRLDTEKVEPLAHAVDVVNAFREDRVTNEPRPEVLLANAPAREKTFIKVPKIIE